jgi:hypothetical protein
VEHFKLTNGSSFDLNGRWTATMIKEDDHWLIASLHVSTDMFDNVILDMMKKFAIRACVIALAAGLILGCVIGMILRGRRKTAVQTSA